LLPLHLGANLKDFQRSKWLADNLRQKPYYEEKISLKKEEVDLNLDDPDVVKEREWQHKVKKEEEKFEETVF
jgi:hypothetical protein